MSLSIVADHIDPEMLKANYIALRLCIIDETVSMDRAVNALIQKFPTGDKRKTGPKPRLNAELLNMKNLLESGWLYKDVAEKYGLRRGDNVYQMLKRAGMLPENKIRGRKAAAI